MTTDGLPAKRPDLSIASSLPAHVRIEQWLRTAIDAEELVPGDKLPREKVLAAALGVSRMTLRQALATLEGQGALERRPGRDGGTFITEPTIEVDLTGLIGFTAQMRRARVRAGARIISASTVLPPRVVIKALGLGRGDLAHEVIRVRSANRKPLAIERAYFPAGPFPDLLDHRLTGSIYSLLARRYQQAPHSADERLEPVIAGAEDATLLEVEPDSPLMLIERTAFTASGLAVEFARDLFRPDRIRITFRSGLRG